MMNGAFGNVVEMGSRVIAFFYEYDGTMVLLSLGSALGL